MEKHQEMDPSNIGMFRIIVRGFKRSRSVVDAVMYVVATVDGLVNGIIDALKPTKRSKSIASHG